MKKFLMALAVALLCAAGIAAAGTGQGSPEPVAQLLSQRLDHMNKQPGVLERQELAVLAGDGYTLPFSGGQLQLYAYRSADEAARDLLNVDETGFQIGDACVEWEQPPHFFLRDNVIVLYIGQDSGILSMLERLCGPQIRGSLVPL